MRDKLCVKIRAKRQICEKRLSVVYYSINHLFLVIYVSVKKKKKSSTVILILLFGFHNGFRPIKDG